MLPEQRSTMPKLATYQLKRPLVKFEVLFLEWAR